ncbi:MAG: hypothetical protein LBU15_02195 [Rickettsiales bacterium]|jgi:hypothetical protein|nr:hypothetical protein [Rickettsiales bacterium]
MTAEEQRQHDTVANIFVAEILLTLRTIAAELGLAGAGKGSMMELLLNRDFVTRVLGFYSDSDKTHELLRQKIGLMLDDFESGERKFLRVYRQLFITECEKKFREGLARLESSGDNYNYSERDREIINALEKCKIFENTLSDARKNLKKELESFCYIRENGDAICYHELLDGNGKVSVCIAVDYGRLNEIGDQRGKVKNFESLVGEGILKVVSNTRDGNTLKAVEPETVTLEFIRSQLALCFKDIDGRNQTRGPIYPSTATGTWTVVNLKVLLEVLRSENLTEAMENVRFFDETAHKPPRDIENMELRTDNFWRLFQGKTMVEQKEPGQQSPGGEKDTSSVESPDSRGHALASGDGDSTSHRTKENTDPRGPEPVVGDTGKLDAGGNGSPSENSEQRQGGSSPKLSPDGLAGAGNEFEGVLENSGAGKPGQGKGNF